MPKPGAIWNLADMILAYDKAIDSLGDNHEAKEFMDSMSPDIELIREIVNFHTKANHGKEILSKTSR